MPDALEWPDPSPRSPTRVGPVSPGVVVGPACAQAPANPATSTIEDRRTPAERVELRTTAEHDMSLDPMFRIAREGMLRR
jgi:hypothetical protein